MRKFYFVIIQIGFLVNVLGQEIPDQVIPPSPTAASLAQYADVPVSHYTGVPNISIPLFNLRSGQIELPVSVSYHASGIKVAQEASQVGLGWVLNAGGLITRQVRGLDDFETLYGSGYLISPMPSVGGNNLPAWSDPDDQQIYNNIKYGTYDGEPDIFYYNFLAYSGKLVFDKQSGNEITAISIDQNNLIFSYKKDSREWTVTDGNGWKYYLGSNSAIEYTTNYGVSSSTPYTSEAQVDYDISQLPGPPDDPKPMITAWYLTKVLTPGGDLMEFSYQNGVETLSQTSYSEMLFRIIDESTAGGAQTMCGLFGGWCLKPLSTESLVGNWNRFSASRQVVQEIYLKSIQFNSGSLEFTVEDRTDIRPFDPNGAKPVRIKSIELLDLNDKLIRQVDFQYSYFNGPRLRLDAI